MPFLWECDDLPAEPLVPLVKAVTTTHTYTGDQLGINRAAGATLVIQPGGLQKPDGSPFPNGQIQVSTAVFDPLVRQPFPPGAWITDIGVADPEACVWFEVRDATNADSKQSRSIDNGIVRFPLKKQLAPSGKSGNLPKHDPPPILYLAGALSLPATDRSLPSLSQSRYPPVGGLRKRYRWPECLLVEVGAGFFRLARPEGRPPGNGRSLGITGGDHHGGACPPRRTGPHAD